MHNRDYPQLPYSDDPKVDYRYMKAEYEKLKKDYLRKIREWPDITPPLPSLPEDPQQAWGTLSHLKEALHNTPIEHMYDTLHECHATLQEAQEPYKHLLAIRSQNRITIPSLLPVAVFLDTILSRSGSSSSHGYFLRTIVKPPELPYHQRKNCEAILDHMKRDVLGHIREDKDEANPRFLDEAVDQAVNKLARCEREAAASKAEITSTLKQHGIFPEGRSLILDYMDDRSPTDVAKEVLLGTGTPYNEEWEVSDDEDERFGNGNQTLGRSLLMSMTG